MWQMSLPWWEFVLRGVIIYVFLTVLLRLTGSRQMGHIGSLDMILLLVLSNTVQNAMNGGDNSLGGGLILAGSGGDRGFFRGHAAVVVRPGVGVCWMVKLSRGQVMT